MTSAPTIQDRARAAREAAATLAATPTERKNAFLNELADALTDATDAILAANQDDLNNADAADIDHAKRKRLVLDAAGIARTAEGLRTIAALPDPVGRITQDATRPNGLRVQRVRCPIGVIAMIYEARPAVTIDAFALCLKSGNAAILKGGKEADRSNAELARIAERTLEQHNLPTASLVQMTATSRDDLKQLLALNDHIDLVIPRGGEPLIRFVAEHSSIPTVQHYHGVCHTFVHRSADPDVAIDIIMNAKTSAPATCNTLECVLIDEPILDRLAPRLAQRCASAGVEIRADEAVRVHAPSAIIAAPDDFGREFLDLILAAAVVANTDAAIRHIERFGSRHTDAIVTNDPEAANVFTSRVQSSCVLVNASTRFNDGFELGLGAEIGISTQRVHAFGPMGLEELTVQRYIVRGDGQIRA